MEDDITKSAKAYRTQREWLVDDAGEKQKMTKVELHKTHIKMMGFRDDSGDLIRGLEKVVRFEDEAGNVIHYPWEELKPVILEWIGVEESKE